MNTDRNLWKIIQNGNNKKSLGRDSKGGIIIFPPVSFEEHVAVQREIKVRTLLLQSLPEDHMADSHHLDDARKIWLAVKARFGGNEESKKIRKTMLKQAFSEFSVSKEEALHKGYDRFQKILSQLNQMQAKPDNDDVNIKFLKALPPSWSLEIDVKGRSSYGSRNTIVAPTHYAFIGATTLWKMFFIPLLLKMSQHSKWQMAMLSLRINKFQKKASMKINFNNKDSAIFDRKKARCYNCLQLGHFSRECNVKKVDKKARYSAFKISEVKTKEPKAMVSVDSKLNWNEHDAENKTEEAEQVYGLMAGIESDFAVHGGNAAGGVNPAAAEFAMMGISPKGKIAKQEWEIKFVESLARFDKWQESSKNLVKLLYSSMSTRTKLGLGFKEYIGSDEVCVLTPSVFDPEPENKEVKSLYERFVKAGNMHEVPPTITGTFMPTSYQSDLAKTQATFGSKSNTSSITTSKSNEFVFYDNSDKSSASETNDFAFCVLSPKTNDLFSTVDVELLPKSDVNDPSPINGLPSCSFKENVTPPRNLYNKSRTADRILCKNNFARTKKCFVCGGKSHLIKDYHVYDTVDNVPSVVLKAASVPVGSRNSSASTSAGRSIPAASRNRSASIHAGRSIPVASRNKSASIHAYRSIPAGRINKLAPFLAGSSVPTGWTNPAARPFFRPTNLYFHNVHPHVNKDIGIVDSGCSRSMTGNKEKLDDFVQVKGGIVTFRGGDGLPLKLFTNEYKGVACNKGKQHKASYKDISAMRIISEPLQLLHMDLFGPTSIRSIDHKYYSLVVTNDFKNQLNKKIKAIRCDNRTEFLNANLIALCGEKGIKRDYSNARTPQQNGVAEQKNRTLIEAARSMLADSKLPTMFWTEAVSTALTILNTSDHLEKFKGKANDGFLVGYAAHRSVQEWYFDLDYLTDSLGYTRFKTNPPACTHDTNIIAGTQADDSKSECDEQVILVPSFPSNSFSGHMVHDVSALIENNLDYAEELARLQRKEYEAHSAAAKHGFEFSVDTTVLLHQAAIEARRNLVLAAGDPAGSIVSTGGVPAGSVSASGVPAGSLHASSVSTSGVPAGSVLASGVLAGSLPASSVHAGGVIAGSIDSAEFGVPAASKSVPAVFTNDPAATSPLPPGHSLGSCEHTLRFPSPSDLGNHQPTVGIFSSSSYDADFCADVTNLASTVVVDPIATKRVNTIHPQSQIIEALQSPVQTRSTVQKSKFGESAFISYMQQFYHQQVWKPVPLSAGKIAIGTKWILKNKRDARGIMVRNKVRLVAQGHRQEEGINYDEVYVDDIIFGSTNKAWCHEFEVLMKGEFEMSDMGELTFFLGLQVKQLPDGIFISQDKYVKDMLKKFDMKSVRTAATPYEVPKHKTKDDPDDAVNVYLFRYMIGSLMYLTAFRPDIMFAVSACSRHQVTPMTSHLNAVKKIFNDSDYAGSHGDRKSTTGRCQFLGRRLISWQCKKQTVVATSSTEAEYVAAASCCGQSTICIVKNPVFHQRTKHIEIRHHFIRDANEKNLIQVLKIHTDENVADLLTKDFDGLDFIIWSPMLLVVLVHADGSYW
nr:hypothetical protein [Tanacetum cinerariifolium]